MRGIIPAYAGSTRSTIAAESSPTDHPRIRGEHSCLIIQVYLTAGSSPHTRGALFSTGAHALSNRIIPAYAGSTGSLTVYWGRRRDHPRIRGEHTTTSPWRCSSVGSSPHTRGALARLGRILEIERIIPAYAGSTSTVPIALIATADHPRIRGEHL